MRFNVRKTFIIIYTLIALCFVFSDSVFVVDYFFDNFIMGMRDESGTSFWGLVTFLGSKYTILLLSLAFSYLLWLLPNNNIKNLQVFWLTFISSAGTGFLLKNLIGRDRPLGAELIEGYTYSFPSGHALTSFFFYGYVIYIIFKHFEISLAKKYFFSIILSLVIIAVGFSRIYLGVHYLSDVLGGYVLGWFWLNFASSFFDNHTQKKKYSMLRVSS